MNCERIDHTLFMRSILVCLTLSTFNLSNTSNCENAIRTHLNIDDKEQKSTRDKNAFHGRKVRRLKTTLRHPFLARFCENSSLKWSGDFVSIRRNLRVFLVPLIVHDYRSAIFSPAVSRGEQMVFLVQASTCLDPWGNFDFFQATMHYTDWKLALVSQDVPNFTADVDKGDRWHSSSGDWVRDRQSAMACSV